MKNFILFLLLICFSPSVLAQKFHLQIDGKNKAETKTIDSIGYTSKHPNPKLILDEINSFSDKLSKIGYIENKSFEPIKKNDSTYVALFSLGEKTKTIHIYVDPKLDLSSILPEIKNDSIIIDYNQAEWFLNKTLEKIEQKGFALTQLNLKIIDKRKNILFADLQSSLDKKRKIDGLIVKYGEEIKKNELPKGHFKQLNSKYKNQIFNKNSVQKIYADFEKFRFINQIKYPEVLFTTDTTKVFVYLEKRKANTFDGFIGFKTDDNNKVVFNGYLDLILENTIKAGEKFSIYWRSDGKDQKTFKTDIEIPYIFNTKLGVKANISIFKQDSIFQNTKTSLDLGYLINYNSRVYIGFQSTESSNIQQTKGSDLQDYENSFYTFQYEFSKYDYDLTLFPKKAELVIKTGFGARNNLNSETDTQTSNQFYINLQALYTFEINKKNYFNLSSQNYYLNSDTYLINELYRFGGINNIRGFAENSLQAQMASIIETEYRYLISPNMYLHTLFDYAVYKDPFYIENNIENLKSFGIGIGINTKNGLLKIIFANGIDSKQKSDFYNTIISMNFNVKF